MRLRQTTLQNRINEALALDNQSISDKKARLKGQIFLKTYKDTGIKVFEVIGNHLIAQSDNAFEIDLSLSAEVKKALTSAKVKTKTTKAAKQQDLFLKGLECLTPQQEAAIGCSTGLGRAKEKSTYELITDMVVKKLENEKVLPWQKPWIGTDRKGKFRAKNFASKNTYSGVNAFILNYLFEYDINYYLTLKQIKKLKGKLVEGAERVPIVYYTAYYKNNETDKIVSIDAYKNLSEDQQNDYTFIQAIKHYWAYNAEFIEGIDWGVEAPEPLTPKEQIETAEAVFNSFKKGSKLIIHKKRRAFYNPNNDTVNMPPIELFKKEQEYYSTLYHEYIHSTAHKTRLNRLIGDKFGSKNYALEELVAELGASFLCGEAGILYFTLNNSVSYLKGWKESLLAIVKKDSGFIFKAASEAQKAVEYLIQKEPTGNPHKYLKEDESKEREYTKAQLTLINMKNVNKEAFESILDKILKVDKKDVHNTSSVAEAAQWASIKNYSENKEIKESETKQNRLIELGLAKSEDFKSKESVEDQLSKLVPTEKDFNFEFYRSSFYWNSFSPDKRAKDTISGVISDLNYHKEDILSIKNKNTDYDIVSAFKYFVNKYLTMHKDYYAKRGRTASSMITGPANFPVKSNARKSEIAHRALEAFLSWKKQAFDRILNKYNQDYQDNRPISSSDSEAVEKLQNKLEALKKVQATMVAANKIIRDKKKTDEDKMFSLIEVGLSEKDVTELMKPDKFGGIGFASFELTNNNAKIKQVESRIKELQAIKSTDDKNYTFKDFKVIFDNQEVRIKLEFTGKPPVEVRTIVKKNGYNWSPRNGVWQRKNTPNARYSLTKFLIPELQKHYGVEGEKPVLSGVKKPTKKPLGNTPQTKQLPTQIDNIFLRADQEPCKPAPDSFVLKGEIGKFFQKMQPYKYAISIKGERFSGKSTFLGQVVDAVADSGFTSAFASLEMGDMRSKDTQKIVNENIKPKNKQLLSITGELPEGINTLKKYASNFDFVFVDSWQKLKIPQTEFDSLRNDCSDTLWFVIFQENADGGMRGGNTAGFDCNVELEVIKPTNDYRDNYVMQHKNRGGNNVDVVYNIFEKKTYPKYEYLERIKAKLNPVKEETQQTA